MGTVPARRAYICVRPHGSKRDGTRSMSEPAMTLWARVLVVSEAHRKTIAVLLLEVPEPPFDVPVAGAEDHHPHGATDEIPPRPGHDVEALLPDEPGDSADEWQVGELGETERAQQVRLACGLPEQIARSRRARSRRRSGDGSHSS